MRVARLLTLGLLVAALALPALGASADDVVVTIGERLDPAELTVTVGTAVTWVNDGDERHRMRSRDGAAEFDSGNLEPGGSFTFVFDVPGDHPYVDERDEDDPAYHGLVTVTSSERADDGAAASGPDEPNGAGGPSDADQAPSDIDVAILDRSFSPAAATVRTGATVTWSNRSDRDHTVTFTSGGGSGELAGGARFSHTFDAPGTFDYLCAIHPDMTGTVTVAGGPTAESGQTGASPSAGTPPPAADGPDGPVAGPTGPVASPQRSPQPDARSTAALTSRGRSAIPLGMIASFVLGATAGVLGSRFRR